LSLYLSDGMRRFKGGGVEAGGEDVLAACTQEDGLEVSSPPDRRQEVGVHRRDHHDNISKMIPNLRMFTHPTPESTQEDGLEVSSPPRERERQQVTSPWTCAFSPTQTPKP